MMKIFVILGAVWISVVLGQGPTGPGVPDRRCPFYDDPRNPTLLPHSRHCSKFYTCSNGLAFPMDCPSGQHFAVHRNRCDWPAVANCNVQGGPRCPTNDDHRNPTLLPHAYDCSRFYICSHGQPHSTQCPPGQHFGVTINRCDWPHVAQCERNSQQCPSDNSVTTFFPHETNCQWYYICNWGNRELRSCPNGQHWWQQMSRCDWPSVVNCNLGTTTTTTTTTTPRSTTSTRSTTTRRSE